MNSLSAWLQKNLLVTALIIFIVMYVVFHFNKLISNKCFYGDYSKTLLWTAIVLLIMLCYFSMCDDGLMIYTKRYRVVNNNNNSLDDIFTKY